MNAYSVTVTIKEHGENPIAIVMGYDKNYPATHYGKMAIVKAFGPLTGASRYHEVNVMRDNSPAKFAHIFTDYNGRFYAYCGRQIEGEITISIRDNNAHLNECARFENALGLYNNTIVPSPKAIMETLPVFPYNMLARNGYNNDQAIYTLLENYSNVILTVMIEDNALTHASTTKIMAAWETIRTAYYG